MRAQVGQDVVAPAGAAGRALKAVHRGKSVRVELGATRVSHCADVLPLGLAAVPGIEPQVADEVLGDAFEVGGRRAEIDRALGAADACDRVRVLIGAVRIIVVADALPLGRAAVPGIEPQLAGGVLRGELQSEAALSKPILRKSLVANGKPISAGHEAMPAVTSCKAASVMLDTKPTHASDAHVAGVRGVLSSLSTSLSSSSSSSPPPPHPPHSTTFKYAPTHVLSGSGVRAVARPQSEAALRTIHMRWSPVKPISAGHEAMPVVMSCNASSVMLDMKPTHVSDAHVAGVRGVLSSSLSSSSSSSSSLPHEENSSPILEYAPSHVLGEAGVRTEVRSHSEAAWSTAPLRWKAE
eukprot:scaffold36955_cov69-Phaeocystis_antarctica.AAC.6